MKCRHCGTELTLPFVDLGSAPPSNSYLTSATLHAPEKWYPLRVMVCTECWLVQTEDFADHEELFSADYAYFSSFSDSWLRHARSYVEAMVGRFALGAASHIVEVAANDGYLLQYARERGIPCLGVEPTASTAAAARAKGIEIVESFFGRRLADELRTAGKAADLMAANNVLAHVPDINDFVGGFAILLKENGVATFEFPHLLRLVEGVQFDTVYHEHFSYLSLSAVTRIFERNGLRVCDVEELSTHGGSLRVFAQRAGTGALPVAASVGEMLARERAAGMTAADYYRDFQPRAEKIKDDLLQFLIDAKRSGKTVAAYGAAAKGNTLLNFAGVRPDLVSFVADRNPAKQGKYMPGSRIPIVAESALQESRPDHVLVLPWNLAPELGNQLSYVRQWGGQLVSAVPRLMQW
ncbi:MAG: class I SAM-dependent methyltransferase [Candidatus Accumulibacter sp.]|uniref:class I SAM-dependent methyltransferase n=1 Tax=Accumulibacter sp. TaxID=2053492 RepID=UPI00287AF7B7|nr:class I SAM-dependent methyltransferase [Accumulibacter sp.]MDS4016644.1 class I SAM-dependent methyltransferase [Accumulibacter sp.]